MSLLAFGLALAWCGFALRARLAAPPLPDLPAIRGADPPPRVSILVAVRNEMDRILDRSLHSVLGQDYPDFEVVAVDDHSEDGSDQRLLQIGRTSPRLRVVRAASERRGKRRALAQVAQQATGSWLLLTDADAVLAPDALARGVAHAQRERLDALSLLPRTLAISFWEQVALAATAWIVFDPRGLARCNDDRAPVGLAAAGPYLLVRRAAYAAVGGYDEVDQNVLVDVALARRLRAAGFRYRYLRSGGCVSTRMYRSLAEIWRGFGKNAFAALDRRPALAAASVLGLSAVGLPLPLLGGCLLRGDLPGTLLALAALVGMAAAQLRGAGFMGSSLRPLPLLLAPAGAALWAGIVASSAWAELSDRGVTWKGRRLAVQRGGEATT